VDRGHQKFSKEKATDQIIQKSFRKCLSPIPTLEASGIGFILNSLKIRS